MKILHYITVIPCLTCALLAQTAHEPEFSRAGFYSVADSGRQAANFNIGWRFHRGDVTGAELRDFDDRAWQLVSTPHSVDGALPEMVSGGANYQGPAWYRKTFTPTEALSGKSLEIHFEGILGKSKIWVNGKLLGEHFSGFLPAIIDVTSVIEPGKPNVVAVLADNSNDPSFPPGKPQSQLDYTYFGGIYRDVWLVSTDKVRITNANAADTVAGGGVFFHTTKLDDSHCEAGLKVQVKNGSLVSGNYQISCELRDPLGKVVATANAPLDLAAGESADTSLKLNISNPAAWTPDLPNLHQLHVLVSDNQGRIMDAVRLRVGLKTIHFSSEKGFVLNGKPFPGKLIGTNRHQDHAVIGYALSNNQHWLDVKKLRDAGLRVVRNAHYPQDPAFMDACDELGMLVIVNTPGWQFWNNDPIFEQRVYSDIRNMVRRDRNHASVLLWEPILNETHYPKEFAKNTHDITHTEFPYPGCYTAADSGAEGHWHFDVQFAHPPSGSGSQTINQKDLHKVFFTREWGDNVDDWSAQNSPSRVAREWGEIPQLVQAIHYAKPVYPYSCLDSLYRTRATHFGGTFWHSFDHQRGYHPFPFLGGIMDGFRRPKLSYEMFRAHRPADVKLPLADSGPTVFVANLMTPFSPEDVTVFSNCESVRLSVHGNFFAEKKVSFSEGTTFHLPVITFEKAFDFMETKRLSRASKVDTIALTAEGIIGGKVVCTHTVKHSQRGVKIGVTLENENQTIFADGSSVVTVVASIQDKHGTVKRLNQGAVRFTITGEGELIGDESVGANPRIVKWGEAPALIRVGTKPGKIRVVASFAPDGEQMPTPGMLEFETKAAPGPFIQDETPILGATLAIADPAAAGDLDALRLKLRSAEKELNLLRNREVERQQSDFENLR